jgi:hypothetical protein
MLEGLKRAGRRGTGKTRIQNIGDGMCEMPMLQMPDILGVPEDGRYN